MSVRKRNRVARQGTLAASGQVKRYELPRSKFPLKNCQIIVDRGGPFGFCLQGNGPGSNELPCNSSEDSAIIKTEAAHN